ncbi:ABC transporter ATP-binding protein [Nocardioides lijunqiniae]|uniref:ABC transporter ATP-binding protein n=1 Tax=Nocardioides lijunqiniae TaxID=2760832 RepID=UPI0018775EA9|nr:ATP-binding cassette domain-containing protein [Nocardioides lijunqiniae]
MIRVSGLSKRYGDRDVLTDVSFEVAEGEMFGFIGANGAGKSTTMRAIMGVLAPTAGSITWHGQPLTRETRRRFGYMPEERGLYQKMKVAEQIAYFGQVYGLDHPAAARAADELIERLDLTRHRDDEVQALSLGNQQRAQLAVALVHSPELLVLDEPFSGLDPTGVDALAEILRERQQRGTPVIFSSHQLELVERLISSVGIIVQGRMVAVGTVDEVRQARTEPRLRVSLSGARPGWHTRLPGRLHSVQDPGTAVVAPDGVSRVDILQAAMREGTVDHFGWLEPSLADVFREVVA